MKRKTPELWMFKNGKKKRETEELKEYEECEREGEREGKSVGFERFRNRMGRTNLYTFLSSLSLNVCLFFFWSNKKTKMMKERERERKGRKKEEENSVFLAWCLCVRFSVCH